MAGTPSPRPRWRKFTARPPGRIALICAGTALALGGAAPAARADTGWVEHSTQRITGAGVTETYETWTDTVTGDSAAIHRDATGTTELTTVVRDPRGNVGPIPRVYVVAPSGETTTTGVGADGRSHPLTTENEQLPRTPENLARTRLAVPDGYTRIGSAPGAGSARHHRAARRHRPRHRLRTGTTGARTTRGRADSRASASPTRQRP